MKTLNSSLGARATVLCAIASFAVAAPASADEAAYLMYLKGSEGPPAVPMRVVWDARDDANGRVTIDLGEKYEPALTKLGLPRVLEYFLTASPVPGAWAQPADVKVHTAALLITPARERLELIARLYVTYLDPQKSGPPKVQDLIKGDIIFVGQPESAASGDTAPPGKR